jgi:hypothetical protein
MARDHDDATAHEPVELARLADGTLPAGRRAALESRVAASPEFAERLAEQRRAIGMLDAVAAPAPDRLRQRIAAERRRALPAARRRRVGFVAGIGVAAAAAALSIAFLLPSGVPGGTVIADAAELQAQPATNPPPAAASRATLDLTAEGLPFPNYGARFDWKTQGWRQDTVHGRSARTVFYTRNGKRVGYTILSGSAISAPTGARHRRVSGTTIHSFDRDGRTIVTWLRGGRTCVMSATDVKRGTLYSLAGWKAKGKLPF